MNVSAELLVWLFAIMGSMRIAIILRKHEVSSSEYKSWAKKISIIITWLLAIYGFIAFSKVRSITEDLNGRYVWVAAGGGGYWLRESPSEQSGIVQDSIFHNLILVPTGKKVAVLERGLNPENINGQSGAWYKVEYNGYKGYCFDAWMLSESDVLSLAKSYVSYLGGKNKKKACALQTKWSDPEKFASPMYFGGITETETISSSFKSVAGEGSAWVHIAYLAVDPQNDGQIKTRAGLTCMKTGIVYEEKFLIKRQPDGNLKIADFMRLKSRCPG